MYISILFALTIFFFCIYPIRLILSQFHYFFESHLGFVLHGSLVLQYSGCLPSKPDTVIDSPQWSYFADATERLSIVLGDYNPELVGCKVR